MKAAGSRTEDRIVWPKVGYRNIFGAGTPGQ